MNNSIQDNLMQENDTGYTDEELNMLAEGEPAIDLEEIAESQYELSDDYMAEEKEQELDIKVIKASEKSEDRPVFFTDKNIAAEFRKNRTSNKQKNSDYGYF